MDQHTKPANPHRLSVVEDLTKPLDRIEALAEKFGQHPDLVRELITNLQRPTKTLLTIPEVGTVLAISRPTVYRLIDAGKLERVHVGAASRITVKSVDSYVESLIAAARESSKAS